MRKTASRIAAPPSAAPTVVVCAAGLSQAFSQYRVRGRGSAARRATAGTLELHAPLRASISFESSGHGPRKRVAQPAGERGGLSATMGVAWGLRLKRVNMMVAASLLLTFLAPAAAHAMYDAL